jgi:hypothetical protein
MKQMHTNHRAAAPSGITFDANRAKKVKNTVRTWEVPLESTKPEKKVPQNHPQIPPKHAQIHPKKTWFPAPNPSLKTDSQPCREKTQNQPLSTSRLPPVKLV